MRSSTRLLRGALGFLVCSWASRSSAADPQQVTLSTVSINQLADSIASKMGDLMADYGLYSSNGEVWGIPDEETWKNMSFNSIYGSKSLGNWFVFMRWGQQSNWLAQVETKELLDSDIRMFHDNMGKALYYHWFGPDGEADQSEAILPAIHSEISDLAFEFTENFYPSFQRFRDDFDAHAALLQPYYQTATFDGSDLKVYDARTTRAIGELAATQGFALGTIGDIYGTLQNTQQNQQDAQDQATDNQDRMDNDESVAESTMAGYISGLNQVENTHTLEDSGLALTDIDPTTAMQQGVSLGLDFSGGSDTGIELISTPLQSSLKTHTGVEVPTAKLEWGNVPNLYQFLSDVSEWFRWLWRLLAWYCQAGLIIQASRCVRDSIIHIGNPFKAVA